MTMFTPYVNPQTIKYNLIVPYLQYPITLPAHLILRSIIMLDNCKLLALL